MRARRSLGRLAALAALTVPLFAGVLLLTPGRALADDSPSTITCPKGGSAGGGTVTGTGHSCGTYGRTNALVITATVSCTSSPVLGIPQCSQGDPTFVVTAPSGSQLTKQAVAPGKQGTYTVPAGAPAGTYTATLSGGGADVSATLQLLDPASAGSATTQPPATSGTGAGTDSGAASSGGGSSTVASGTGPNGPGTASGGAYVPLPGNATPPAARTGDLGVIPFPDIAPPAGLAALAPLPAFPPAPGTQEPTDAGTYGKTLPYSGSVPMAAKAASPSLLHTVADNTVGNRQLLEAVAAAALALLGAAHLRRLARHGLRDADL